MAISDLTEWFWPALSFLLGVLWLATLLWRRSKQPGGGPLVAERPHERVAAEDLLKTAYARRKWRAYPDVDELAHEAGMSGAAATEGMEALVAFGWAAQDAAGGVRLTEQGESRAQQLIRAHRLWERYLVDHEGMALEDVHAEAHRREHGTTLEELERLDTELEHPAWDPHGHAIPAPSRQVPSSPGEPLSEGGERGSRVRVVCLDDEPPELLAQFIALGLSPGAEVTIIQRDESRLLLDIDGSRIPIASSASSHIWVVPAPALPIELGKLPVGCQARVVALKGVGKHQRRMLDMGFVPGATVSVSRVAPLGDPVEYQVKGTAVALRRHEASTILVEEVNGE